jgi:tRNA pseudouridine13 synthase
VGYLLYRGSARRTVTVDRFRPPERERSVGLDFYATSTEPLGGRLKDTAADFRVREISLYPRPDPDGPFTVLRVESQNWEQHELAERIARRLGLAPHALRWAGTKDRRAISERLLSYRGPPPSTGLDLPDVTLIEAYRARDGLVLGHHFGNAFSIRISDPAPPWESAASRAASTREALNERGGFPNFFGLQRFGEVRPVTHLVGQRLVAGDPAGAVEAYLTAATGEADLAGEAARAQYAQHHDARRALAEFPSGFRFERQLLAHLAAGHSPERALRALSHELRLLFIHAYQALLFNRWLSRRWALGLPLDAPVEGDHLLRVTRDGTVPGTDPVLVSADNLPECTDLAHRGRARLAGPLVGYGTPTGSGTGGEILESILSEEGIQRPSFETPRTPDLASRGSWRPAWVGLPPVGIRADEPQPEAPGSLWLTFSLPKGCYATVLLREFLKQGSSDR